MLRPGRLISMESEYDAHGNLQFYRGQYGQSWQFDYYPDGQVKSETDALGNTTQFAYHPDGKIESQQTGSGDGASKFEYDALGYLWRVEDANGNYTYYTRNGFGQVEVLRSPDAGTTQYFYAVGGRVDELVKGGGEVISFEYDAVGRVVKTTASGKGAQSARYFFDEYNGSECGYGKGRLCAVVDSSGSVEYEYNQSGQIKRQLTRIGDSEYIIEYGYDEFGNLETQTYPDPGVVVTYYHDKVHGPVVVGMSLMSDPDVGRLVALSTFKNVQSETRLLGDITSGLWVDYERDVNGRLSKVSSSLFDKDYRYNKRNLLELISGDIFTPYKYEYDAAGRVTLEDDLSSDRYYRYGYDDNGNRDVMGSSYTSDSQLNYSRSNRLQSVETGSSIRSFDYDSNGSLIRTPSRKYEYDSFGRMSGMEWVSSAFDVRAEYAYNFSNLRVKKTIHSEDLGHHEEYRYLYDQSGRLVAETDASGENLNTIYIYFRGELTGFYRNGELFSVVNDQVGRPELVIAEDGQTSSIALQRNSKAFTSSGHYSSAFEGGLNIGFPGQYYDYESSLWYNHNRYYDASLGRYIQSDPIGLAGGGIPMLMQMETLLAILIQMVF